MVVSDTFGRPWRKGLTDVAIGCAGIAAVVDLRGTTDTQGRPLQVTEVAVADELAGAAELVMGKASGICAAVVRGVDRSWLRDGGSVRSEIVRPPVRGSVPVAIERHARCRAYVPAPSSSASSSRRVPVATVSGWSGPRMRRRST